MPSEKFNAATENIIFSVGVVNFSDERHDVAEHSSSLNVQQ